MDYWDILFTDFPDSYSPLIHCPVPFLQQFSVAPHCYFMSSLGNTYTGRCSKVYLDKCLKPIIKLVYSKWTLVLKVLTTPGNLLETQNLTLCSRLPKSYSALWLDPQLMYKHIKVWETLRGNYVPKCATLGVLWVMEVPEYSYLFWKIHGNPFSLSPCSRSLSHLHSKFFPWLIEIVFPKQSIGLQQILHLL